MDDQRMPKLETEAFRPVQKPPRLRWQPHAASKVRSEHEDKTKRRQRWRTAAQNTAARLRRGGTQKQSVRDDDDAGYRKLLIKTGICAAIAVAILGISSIGSPVTDDITRAVGNAVSHEFDIEEDIGRLRFVQNLTDDAQSVFSPTPEDAVMFPADGDVITKFGEGGSKGIRIQPRGSEIVSIAKGTVTAVGEASGSGFVKIALSAGERAVLSGLVPAVEVDDIVFAGQPIGELSDDYLYLEIKQDENYIDPIEYIQSRLTMASE